MNGRLLLASLSATVRTYISNSRKVAGIHKSKNVACKFMKNVFLEWHKSVSQNAMH